MSQTVESNRFRSLVDRHPDPRTALLPALWRLIESGRLSPDDIREAAESCRLTPEAVQGLLDSCPGALRGESEPAVCTDLVCGLMGAEQMRQRLGAETGSLPRAVSCLGHCHAAPVGRTADGRIHRLCRQDNASDE